jgi:cytochrome c556
MRETVPIMILALILTLGLTGCGSTEESTSTTVNDQSEAPENKVARKSSRADTLPLINIMLNLEREMQSISSGLWRHDFEQITSSAERIADHAKIKPSEVKTIRDILGEEDFKSFVKDDKTVHNMAVRLSEAAGRENFEATAEAYQKLEQGCISCHRTHRNRLRDSEAW